MTRARFSVLYVGAMEGTSLHRAEALRRLGHDVVHVSPYMGLPDHWALWLRHAGGLGLDGLVKRALLRQIDDRRSFDLALVDCGDVIGPTSLAVISSRAGVVGNYNADNPYRNPSAEGRRWTLFRRIAGHYDLSVTPRRSHVEQEMRALGVTNPMIVWQCADEVAHRPVVLGQEWASDIAFVGTWMPGRGAFLAALIDLGLPISIYGARWHKAPECRRLAPAIRAGHLHGDDYGRAIGGAKVALVLLNEANDDLHTSRSVEIPAIGTAMCAPRTAHHQELYAENEEAVFFSSVEECAAQCKRLLADRALRERVSRAGQRRFVANRTSNEVLMGQIIERLAVCREARRAG